MENKNTYAIGSDGPVMYNGTVFKDQKSLNGGLAFAFIVAGFLPFCAGMILFAWILWIIGGLAILAAIGGKK